MKIIIASNKLEKEFNDVNVINIGSTESCHYKINLPFELVLSLQKQENGKWQIINVSKSDKVLFKGQPIGNGLEITSVCKLIIDGYDEFISIKLKTDTDEIQEKRNNAKIIRVDNRRTISSIGSEELNEQDIKTLYGKGSGAQTKIKIDRIKADIEKRRTSITKDIAYRIEELRSKISLNEGILWVLNLLIFTVPFLFVYILKDVWKIESNNGFIQTKIFFILAVAFIIVTLLLKQGQFLTLYTMGKSKVPPSTERIKVMCLLVSIGIFVLAIAFSIQELFFHVRKLDVIIPQMTLTCSLLCIFLGIFAGFTKNIITESTEELDRYENREDFQVIIKDYQHWVDFFVNNLTKKKLKDISNKIFNLQIMCVGEYILGVITAPFLAYGVSQTLAEALGDNGLTLAGGFRFSPIFLTLATFMIIFAFHCFAVAFCLSKRVFASNVIKHDGFSDYNVHGVMIHGTESTKNLKKESKKFFLIAVIVVLVEILMNMSYFVAELGDDIFGMIKAVLAALIPTALLIMETNMVANTKFEIKIKEELLEKVDKDY